MWRAIRLAQRSSLRLIVTVTARRINRSRLWGESIDCSMHLVITITSERVLSTGRVARMGDRSEMRTGFVGQY
jgi:hypothetical protein